MRTGEGVGGGSDENGSAGERGGMTIFCLCFRGAPADFALTAFAEACLRYTPDLALRTASPAAIFLEVGRCLSLYSEASLAARLRRLARTWGLPDGAVSLGRGGNLARAWVSALHGVEETRIDSLPIAAVADLLDPLGRSVDERPRFVALSEILFRLGVRRVGAIDRLPSDSAVSRFGATYEALLRARTETESRWERFKPLEKLLERVDLDRAETIGEIDPVLFHAKGLLDRVLRRTDGRGMAIARLTLRLECEKRRLVRETWLEIRLEFTFPQSTGTPILRVLRERFAHAMAERLRKDAGEAALGESTVDFPIVALELEATELSPKASAQGNFLDTEESRLEPENERYRELLTELSTKLAVGEALYQVELVASWRPEASWRKVLKDPRALSSAPVAVPERPLRILFPPEPLRRLGRYLFWGNRRFSIREISERERISGEWWEEAGGFSRTYHRVRVEETGAEAGPEPRTLDFWVFREHGEGSGVFLHGVY